MYLYNITKLQVMVILTEGWVANRDSQIKKKLNLGRGDIKDTW